jgi:hypothetical protein
VAIVSAGWRGGGGFLGLDHAGMKSSVEMAISIHLPWVNGVRCSRCFIQHRASVASLFS